MRRAEITLFWKGAPVSTGRNPHENPSRKSIFPGSEDPLFSRVHTVSASEKLAEPLETRDAAGGKEVHFRMNSAQPVPEAGGFFGGILRSPILWGAALTAAFYAFLFSGKIESEFMMRYFAGSQIEYVEVGLFFVGMAALLLKWKDIRRQAAWMAGRLKGPERRFLNGGVGAFSSQQADLLLEKLRELPAGVRNGYFISRLENTLDFVARNRSAIGVEDEMKYLSDMDAERMSQSYSLIRLVVWAIPILGFLGTVMGITLAIGALSGNLSDTAATLPQMIAGLSVAFDTTAIALAFSIVLMFTQFLVEKSENRLLTAVDFQVHRELSGRFDPIPDTMEGAVLAIRRVGEVVLDGMQKQTATQASMWEETFRHVELEWFRRLETLGATVSEGLQRGLAKGGEDLGVQVSGKVAAVAGNAAVDLGSRIASQLEKQLIENAEKQLATQIATIKEMHKIMADQSSMIHEAVRRNVENTAKNVEVISKSSEIFYHAGNQMESAGSALVNATKMAQQVAEMEQVLTHNLSTLQGAKNFERTVAELSAATSMLAAWLEEVRGTRRAA